MTSALANSAALWVWAEDPARGVGMVMTTCASRGQKRQVFQRRPSAALVSTIPVRVLRNAEAKHWLKGARISLGAMTVQGKMPRAHDRLREPLGCDARVTLRKGEKPGLHGAS